MSVGLGAEVTVLDTNINRLRELDALYHGRLRTLASNSFEALKLFDSETIHYDDQGVAIEDGGDLRSSSYIVRVKPGGSSVNAMLPGGTLPETTLLRFQVQIAATPSTEFNFDSAPRNAYESMPVLIAPLVP
jgi:alanine dehydrogenase